MNISMNSLPDFQRPLRFSEILVAERPSSLHLGDFRGQNYIGAYTYLNQDSIIYSTVLGRFTSIGHRVMIAATEHPTDWLSTHTFTHSNLGPFSTLPEYQAICTNEEFPQNEEVTFIGNDVWIGYGVYIRRGVKIGDGAIIGAGSVVTKDVEPYMIVAGSPAKPIRSRFPAIIIERLQRLQWWNYVLDKSKLPGIRYADPAAALGQLERAIADRELDDFTPAKIAFVRTNAGITVQTVE